MTAAAMLGETWRDKVTGFNGVCMAFCTYLTGCDQVCLQPKMKDDGIVPDAKWFDVTRMMQVMTEPKVIIEHTPTTAGADMSLLSAKGMRV